MVGWGAQQRGCPVREKKVEGVKMKERQGGSGGERREITLVCSIKCVTDLSKQFLYKK